MRGSEIVQAALNARTLRDAEAVQDMIAAAVGTRHQRPLGDRWQNFGLMTSAGSYDHKLIENVTNMQDAVLELHGLLKFGDPARVPFGSPHEAANVLFGSRDHRDLAENVVVEFFESDPPARTTKRLTVVFRDRGCGITPSYVPESIFHLGSSHKDGYDWLQGAFGLGGTTTFRNAKAVVLVSRRHPKLLTLGEQERIAVAVVLWEKHRKGMGAYYLVTGPWPGNDAYPYSVPAGEYPEFTPGTHLALVSYGVEGYHRHRLGDERSFDTVLNTRLFDPVTPVRFTDRILERDRREYLRGLRQRLQDNPRADRRESGDVLPYRVEGKTYHLPIRFHVFAARGDPGERRKFVAYDHAVLFTSNGQTHYHWTPQEFRLRTGLTKVYDRILVVVETDELPIYTRTSLFTPTRTDLNRDEAAIRLEEQVAGFLHEWPDLVEINQELIREAITKRDGDSSTLEIAKQISRALRLHGFQLAGHGKGPVRPPRIPPSPVELFLDPTTLEGPERVVAEAGKTKFVTYLLNAVDYFIPRRARLAVRCDHPDVTDREITVGELRSGRARVSIAVPTDAKLGVFRLAVSLIDWMKASGGLGAPMHWDTELEVVPENGERPQRPAAHQSGASEGPLVAVVWVKPDKLSDPTIPGEVQPVAARDLAARIPEYSELASLGEKSVPTLMLNEEFPHLKRYVSARVHELSATGIQMARNRYAVGVGVGLLLLDETLARRMKTGEKIDEEYVRASQRAVARSVLSIMPEYDALAKEAGLTPQEPIAPIAVTLADASSYSSE